MPLISGERVLGVLDLDSPRLARFDTTDAEGLGAIVALLLRRSDLTRCADAATREPLSARSPARDRRDTARERHA